jgi:hypothetical protein
MSDKGPAFMAGFMTLSLSTATQSKESGILNFFHYLRLQRINGIATLKRELDVDTTKRI